MKNFKSINISELSEQEQTPEICLEAVRQNGLALRHVIKQTSRICLEAVRENGRALEFVKEQTPEICPEAVRQNAFAVKYLISDGFRHLVMSSKTE